jgi:hypothetical protein
VVLTLPQQLPLQLPVQAVPPPPPAQHQAAQLQPPQRQHLLQVISALSLNPRFLFLYSP